MGSSEILYRQHILGAGNLCYGQESPVGGPNGPDAIFWSEAARKLSHRARP